MSLIKIAPGAKLTNSEITGNAQVGGDAMIDNQGEIESSKIDKNIHVPASPEFAGGLTWVDKEFDPHFSEEEKPKKISRLSAAWSWAKDNVLAGIILAIFGALIAWLTTYLSAPPSPSHKGTPGQAPPAASSTPTPQTPPEKPTGR